MSYKQWTTIKYLKIPGLVKTPSLFLPFTRYLPGLRLGVAVHPVAAVGMYRGWAEAQATAHTGWAGQGPRGQPRVVARAAGGPEARGVRALETRPGNVYCVSTVKEWNASEIPETCRSNILMRHIWRFEECVKAAGKVLMKIKKVGLAWWAGVFWFTHFSRFLTQDRRMIIIPVRRKCSQIQTDGIWRTFSSIEHFLSVRHKDVLITSGGWWGWSRGLGRCWVSASPGELESRSSYSWHLITGH